MIKQRSKQFLSDFILLYLGQIPSPDELFCIQKFISWYFPILLYWYSVCSSSNCYKNLYSYLPCHLFKNVPANTAVHSESLGGSVAAGLEFWNCNPEAPSLIHSLTACRICPCLSRVQILIQSHLQIANWFAPGNLEFLTSLATMWIDGLPLMVLLL